MLLFLFLARRRVGGEWEAGGEGSSVLVCFFPRLLMLKKNKYFCTFFVRVVLVGWCSTVECRIRSRIGIKIRIVICFTLFFNCTRVGQRYMMPLTDCVFDASSSVDAIVRGGRYKALDTLWRGYRPPQAESGECGSLPLLTHARSCLPSYDSTEQRYIDSEQLGCFCLCFL